MLVVALTLMGAAAGASVVSAPAAAASEPGSLDLGFGAEGMALTPIGAGADQGNAVAVQADGRIVVAGFSQSGAGERFAVVRYDPDGSLDTTFDGDGRVSTAIGGSRDEAYAVALQPDGKIAVAGFSDNG